MVIILCLKLQQYFIYLWNEEYCIVELGESMVQAIDTSFFVSYMGTI